MLHPSTTASKSPGLTKSFRNTAHSKYCVLHFTPDFLPGVLRNRHDVFANGIAAVRDEIELENFSILFEPAVGIEAPAFGFQQGLRGLGIIRQRLHGLIVPRGVGGIGAGDVFPFAVQQVPEKIFDVNRHPQRPAHGGVGEQRTAIIVADVRIAEPQARKRLVRVVFLVPGDLVGLGPVVIDCAGPKFHFLRQQVGYDPHVIILVFRGPFPIVVIAPEMDVFIAVPLDKTESPAADGVAIELTVAHAEGFPGGVGEAAVVHFPLHGVGVEQVFGKDAHGPGVDRRRKQSFVHHAHRMCIRNFHRLDRFKIRRTREKDSWNS